MGVREWAGEHCALPAHAGPPRLRSVMRFILAVVVGCSDGVRSGGGPDAGILELEGGDPRLDASTPGRVDVGTASFGFQRDIYPIFVARCGTCHSVNGPYHDIASPDRAVAYADALEFAERVVARIRQGSMPPGCVFDDADCVPTDELALIERWISEGTPP